MKPLTRDFFERDPVEVAPELLGCRLISPGVELRLVEVEAYRGGEDPGSHAFRGITPRTQVMFGEPGRAYVYLSYGLHHCLNVVCLPRGVAGAVLFRAGEVIGGREIVARRRSGIPDRDWARGPGRLAMALGITELHNSADLCGTGPLMLLSGEERPSMILSGQRVGVSGEGGGPEYPWRFWIAGESAVSAYRRGSGSAGRKRY